MASLFGVIQGKLDAPDPDLTESVFLDIHFDWVTARAALNGRDASLPVDELAAVEGFQLTSPSAESHPRLPGALFLFVPVSLLSIESATITWFVAQALLVGAIVYASVRLTGGRVHLALAAIGATSVAALNAMTTMNSSTLVSALVLGAIVRDQDDGTSGLMLGTASVLRVWPLALIAFCLVRRRYRTALTGLTSFTAVNLAGLILPGVEIAKSLDAMRDAGRLLVSQFNTSITGFFLQSGLPSGVLAGSLMSGLLVGVAGLRVARGRIAWRDSMLLFSMLSVVAIPVSWASYRLVFLPAWLRSPVLGVVAWSVDIASLSRIPRAWTSMLVTVISLAAFFRSHRATAKESLPQPDSRSPLL